MKPVVLFDMDGTITPPRKKISRVMVKVLKDLSEIAHIGIVTGSGYDYLVQQCEDLWFEIGTVPSTRITLLPCNGTQVYEPCNGNSAFSLSKSVDMREELGDHIVDKIMSSVMHMQFLHMCKSPPHSYTGHFISYRKSLINWCPVGRNANDSQRLEFIKFDKVSDYRSKARSMLEKTLFINGIEDIELALGGSTSIDIFPRGWDKTYSLRHFPDRECWFVGDSCTGSGNDRAIFELLGREKRSFSTNSTEETIKIIDQIIKKIKTAL